MTEPQSRDGLPLTAPPHAMARLDRDPGDRLVAIALAAVLAAALATCAGANLAYPGMWWDEAASFWGSQGLSRYAAPFAARGTLADVVRMNRAENLDPGGFQLLLHPWTAMGTGLTWLRGLPFAFFALTVVIFGALGWRLTRSAPFAVASAAAPLLVPGTVYYAFELRAFSMEGAGVAAGALALVLACERPSRGRFFALGAVTAAFLSSRYSFAFTAAALACAALVPLRASRPDRRTRATRAAALVLPMVAAAVAVAAVTTRYQVWSEMRRGPLGVAAPRYTRASVMRHNPDAVRLALRNLASPPALPITAAALFALFLRRRVDAGVRACGAGNAGAPPDTIGALFVFVVTVQVLSAAASLAGAYPWDIGSRWSAYLLTVSALSAVALAAEGVALARLALHDRPAIGHAACGAGVAAAALVVVAASVQAVRHRQVVQSAHRTDLAPQLDRLPVSLLPPGSVFVTYYEVPVLRYLYEHGPFRGRVGYPRAFRFESFAEWSAAAPIDADGGGSRYVVTALPLAEAQARFPRATLVRACSGDCRLLRVERPGPPG